MSVVVVGSVAFDSIKTPFGEHDRILGGSATYFALAASKFTTVRVVAAVGQDFGRAPLDLLDSHGIDHSGLQVMDGKTFHWKGEYQGDMNSAITHETHLNVLAEFKPHLSHEYRQTPFVFLANIDPVLQADVLDQTAGRKFAACDTMNFWITGKREELNRVLRRVDLLIVNDGEARMLSGKDAMVTAARELRAHGPRFVIIKRGEYGSLMASDAGMFWAPAYPLEVVKDPTGAGDTFAGGVMGFLASQGEVTEANMRQACYYGSVMASFTVEEFSVDALRHLTREMVDIRYQRFLDLVRLEPHA